MPAPAIAVADRRVFMAVAGRRRHPQNSGHTLFRPVLPYAGSISTAPGSTILAYREVPDTLEESEDKAFGMPSTPQSTPKACCAFTIPGVV